MEKLLENLKVLEDWVRRDANTAIREFIRNHGYTDNDGIRYYHFDDATLCILGEFKPEYIETKDENDYRNEDDVVLAREIVNIYLNNKEEVRVMTFFGEYSLNELSFDDIKRLLEYMTTE